MAGPERSPFSSSELAASMRVIPTNTYLPMSACGIAVHVRGIGSRRGSLERATRSLWARTGCSASSRRGSSTMTRC